MKYESGKEIEELWKEDVWSCFCLHFLCYATAKSAQIKFLKDNLVYFNLCFSI